MNVKTTKAFLTYYDSEVMYEMLTDQEAGRLIKAMFRYCKDGEVTLTKEDGVPYAYFVVLKGQFDRDAEKYREQTEKKRERDNERYQREKEEKLKESKEANSPLPFEYERKEESIVKRKFPFEDPAAVNSDVPF